MVMELPGAHVDSLPARARGLLARARDEAGLQQLLTLATVSQMLSERLTSAVASQLPRERLDAADRRLRILFDQHGGNVRRVPGNAAAPRDLIATLADIAACLD